MKIKKIALGVVALTLIVSAFVFIPKVRYAMGYTYKVVDNKGVHTTDGGGMAMYLIVEDYEGNTYEVHSGRVWYWDGMGEDNYVNKDLFTIDHKVGKYTMLGTYDADKFKVTTTDGNVWRYYADDIEKDTPVIVTFDDYGTDDVTDDVILKMQVGDIEQ